MNLGYARISTSDQNLDLQTDALNISGCEKIFIDIISGSKSERKGLKECIEYARKGDTLVIYKLDRLGRSLKELLNLIADLEKREIELLVISQNIDTKTTTGRMLFNILETVAEFERDLIRERVQAGLKAARTRGKIGGRPQALTKEQIENLKTIYETKKVPVIEICKMFDIRKPTMYRYLKKNDVIEGFSNSICLLTSSLCIFSGFFSRDKVYTCTKFIRSKILGSE